MISRNYTLLKALLAHRLDSNDVYLVLPGLLPAILMFDHLI